LNTIKHIVVRYTGMVWAILKPLGAWGVFVIAGLDSALFGLPLDPVVASYIYQNRSKLMLYVFMASAGSAVGSIVLYGIGYKGGHVLLARRISKNKFDQIRRSYERHKFWALMFPSMVPPPFPFKVFALAAAVFEMNFWHFLAAIFAGRFVRFFILGLLVLRFGPGAVAATAGLAEKHLPALLLAMIAAIGLWLFVRFRRPRTAKDS
jgi:membrane protein YqaA with SNARE-associated domain